MTLERVQLFDNLKGPFVAYPKIYRDDRGYFFEAYKESDYLDHLPIGNKFVQDNVSLSTKYTFRGLHYQRVHPQGKLVTVLDGDILDVIVDLRTGSPTHCKHKIIPMESKEGKTLWVPPGFAHGFLCVSDTALVSYKVTEEYLSVYDISIDVFDKQFNIKLPVPSVYLNMSEKDKAAMPYERFMALGN